MSYVDELRELANHDNRIYRRLEIPLKTSLSAVGSGSASFKVEEGKQLVIFGIRGIIAFDDLDSEHANQIGAITSNNRLIDRLIAKASNCDIDLINNDNKLKMFEDEALRLSTLMPLCGGQPIDWTNMPHVVPSGHTIKMTASLLASDTGLIGGATTYGVVLSAGLIAKQ